MSHPEAIGRAYTRTIWAIAIGIFLFAAIVVIRALSIGNRQLMKDGVDWIYDVLLYGIAAIVYGRSDRAEQVSALAIAAIMAVAGLHTIYDLWDKIVDPRPIEPWTLGFSAASAALIAYLIVGALYRFRKSDNPLIVATWLSSRNDAFATTAFAAASFAARVAPTRWYEYALDVFVVGLSFQAAFVIVRRTMTARAEEAGVAPACE